LPVIPTLGNSGIRINNACMSVHYVRITAVKTAWLHLQRGSATEMHNERLCDGENRRYATKTRTWNTRSNYSARLAVNKNIKHECTNFKLKVRCSIHGVILTSCSNGKKSFEPRLLCWGWGLYYIYVCTLISLQDYLTEKYAHELWQI